jgi:hypothetical protein
MKNITGGWHVLRALFVGLPQGIYRAANPPTSRFAVWAAGFSTLLVVGCSKPENPNNYPVSHWLEDGEECTRAAAAAIIKSGLPFPNYGTEDVPATAGNAKLEKRVTTVDMWVGPTRLVIPAKVAASNGFFPQHHPRHYEGMSGSLPNFYPPGPPGPLVDGMGPMVDVRFHCAMTSRYVASWGKGYRSNADGIAKVKRRYEEDLRTSPVPGDVTVNRRDDIGMIEVLMDRHEEANGRRYWEASYWPIDRELKGPDGSVSAIGCKMRHDPVEKRYGSVGWRCAAAVAITPYATATIDIYVSQIQYMPAVFDQVHDLLVNAQQLSGE